MKEIKFNSGSGFQKGGTPMETISLHNLDLSKLVDKSKLPWLQVFNSGYRTTHENINWSTWNGCVFVDIDSKHYYEKVKQFDKIKLEQALYNVLTTSDEFCYNFYCLQRSFSNNSYHIVFYFDVERTESNFKKCAQYSKQLTLKLFESINKTEIIIYNNVLDGCTQSEYQGLYFSHNEILFGNYTDPFFGNWNNIDDYELEETYKYIASDIKDDGTKLFELKSFEKKDGYLGYWEHKQRLSLYKAVQAVYDNNIEQINEAWKEICSHIEPREHTYEFFINEPNKNNWFTYDWTIDVSKLEPFGYKFNKLFEPTITELYEPDIVYNLTENQNLSDIDIKWSYTKINHLYAGCSLGKTYNAKELGKQKVIEDIDFLLGEKNNKVCFISPMRSINKDSFTDVKDWMIVDSDHKEQNMEIYNNIISALKQPGLNVCTTWESFVMYNMADINFDYVIVDEAHTLFMYDYRTTSITNIKKALENAKGIRILMTGTPSAEVEEFNCYKIQVNKKLKEVDVDLVLYNNSFLDYYMKDIREWTVDSTHYAIIFNDVTNFKLEERFNTAGLDIDIFNTNYTENVEYILDNHNVKKQITAFSVYGQAGINLYIDMDKKLRIYILNKNGLGIIQYANRVRNREVIDKIVLGYKKENVSNNIIKLNYNIDYKEAFEKVKQLNSIKKINWDLFDQRSKELIKAKFGLHWECLDRVGQLYELNAEKYKTWKLIKNVEDFEKQIQIIYNRLVANYFKVKVINLQKDIKDIKGTKLRPQYFAGQMTRFDFDQFIEKKDGSYWFKATDEFKKVCTGDLIEKIEDIFNMLVEKYNSKDKAIEVFTRFVRGTIKDFKTIMKTNIVDFYRMLYITKNWESYYDNAFIVAMVTTCITDAQLAALYIRSVWHKDLKWKEITKEVFDEIKSLRRMVDTFRDIFEEYNYYNEYTFENDDLTKEIYTYIENEHKRGKEGKKEIIYKGVTYKDVAEAVEKTGVSRQGINKWIRKNKE